ncbi:uncharacterized protein MELLADRAFT_101947 [Melampsora larici-populina 98AG31]|uniref:Uncharacterized protein n=1 Tax=Melampsora larici-populina (strain 98AG31 / pathotype 3-4-7) TaxID=747676 RepID=F4R5G2_MELLP|nr:uncharacterized protein MELLADRAFT_101947 [Melampsora larici-populina 98AG31]EGG12267.1 hypothetical protein MELLADRAFT_101947 [Melampsora larici-populina 98AG31]
MDVVESIRADGKISQAKLQRLWMSGCGNAGLSATRKNLATGSRYDQSRSPWPARCWTSDASNMKLATLANASKCSNAYHVSFWDTGLLESSFLDSWRERFSGSTKSATHDIHPRIA